MKDFKPSHNHTLVGIDPANEGAIVVLRGTSIPLVFLWKKVTRKKKKVFKVFASSSESNIAQTCICRTSAHIGQFVASFKELSNVQGIAVEDCYLARNAKTTITLARFAGMISSPLVVKSGFEPLYVKPTEWRSVVLGMKKRTNREQAKKASLTYMPRMVHAIKHHLDVLGNYDHITDALGIAVWLSFARSQNKDKPK